MASLTDTIDAIARKLGVPTRIWESVVQVESSGIPGRIGDNGTSFGLFQLHRGGQAPSFLTDAQLLDPVTNAQYGLPALASAWKQLGSTFDDSLTWWSQFAAVSGHPGYDPVLDAQVGTQLKQAYDQNNSSPIAMANTQSGTSSSSSPDVGTWLGEVGLAMLVFLVAIVLVIVAIVLLR